MKKVSKRQVDGLRGPRSCIEQEYIPSIIFLIDEAILRNLRRHGEAVEMERETKMRERLLTKGTRRVSRVTIDPQDREMARSCKL
jgi:hypothetical protein